MRSRSGENGGNLLRRLCARPGCSRPVQRQQSTYCSPECYWVAKQRRWEPRVCPECGLAWTPADRMEARRSTCGLVCGQRVAARAGSLRPSGPSSQRAAVPPGRDALLDRTAGLGDLRILGIEPYGRRSLALETGDGIMTLVIGEWAGAGVADNEAGKVREVLIAALRAAISTNGRGS